MTISSLVVGKSRFRVGTASARLSVSLGAALPQMLETLAKERRGSAFSLKMLTQQSLSAATFATRR